MWQVGAQLSPHSGDTAASGISSSRGVSEVCPHHCPMPFSSLRDTKLRGKGAASPPLGSAGAPGRGTLRPQPRLWERVRNPLGVLSQHRGEDRRACWVLDSWGFEGTPAPQLEGERSLHFMKENTPGKVSLGQLGRGEGLGKVASVLVCGG